MSTRLARRVISKSASFTVSPTLDRAGTLFINRGASGAVTATLPTPTRALLGTWYQFACVVDQNFVVAPPTADTAIVINDLAADSLALSTSMQKIGGIVEAVCVQTGTDAAPVYQWLIYGNTVGHTFTAAT